MCRSPRESEEWLQETSPSSHGSQYHNSRESSHHAQHPEEHLPLPSLQRYSRNHDRLRDSPIREYSHAIQSLGEERPERGQLLQAQEHHRRRPDTENSSSSPSSVLSASLQRPVSPFAHQDDLQPHQMRPPRHSEERLHE